MTKGQHTNPFFGPYNTPHDTVPFNNISLEDFEEAFMEGIRRDNEQIEKTINNPDKPTFDNTIINVMMTKTVIMTYYHVYQPFFSIC